VNSITERLAGRVKGLTPVFPALLLARKPSSAASQTFHIAGRPDHHKEAARI
jgi:hypothetical protein